MKGMDFIVHGMEVKMNGERGQVSQDAEKSRGQKSGYRAEGGQKRREGGGEKNRQKERKRQKRQKERERRGEMGR